MAVDGNRSMFDIRGFLFVVNINVSTLGPPANFTWYKGTHCSNLQVVFTVVVKLSAKIL